MLQILNWLANALIHGSYNYAGTFGRGSTNCDMFYSGGNSTFFKVIKAILSLSLTLSLSLSLYLSLSISFSLSLSAFSSTRFINVFP